MMEVVNKPQLISTYKSKKYANQALSKYGHLLPLRATSQLAKITASLLTDGFIDVRPRNNSIYYGYIGFFSKYKAELIEFENILYSIFKLKGMIKDWGIRKSGTSYGYIIINSYLSRILSLCGVATGDKTKQVYEVPSWILKSNESIQKAFLQKSFDCEGSIRYSSNRSTWEISYSMYKTADLNDNCLRYLNQIRGMLKQFGIDSILYKKEEYIRNKDNKHVIGYCIRISKKKSITNYSKHIGFEHKNKKEKMYQSVNKL